MAAKKATRRKVAKQPGKKLRQPKASPPPPVTSACAREGVGGALCPCRPLGEAFALLLAEPFAHQAGVCAQLGINYRVHMRWMSAECEAGTPAETYQMLVLVALDAQRRRDLKNGQNKLDACHPAKAGPQVNMFRFQHENRFRRFYGDEDVKKVDLTTGGEPLPEGRVTYVVSVPPEEPEQET